MEEARSVRLETVFSVENIVAKIVSGSLEDAFNSASRLSRELGLGYDPIRDWRDASDLEASCEKSVYTRMRVSRSILGYPLWRRADVYRAGAGLRLKALKTLFRLLVDVKGFYEKVYGIPLRESVSREVLDDLLYNVLGIVSPGSMLPEYYDALAISVLAVLSDAPIEDLDRLLDTALRLTVYRWLYRNGPRLYRPRYLEEARRLSGEFNRIYLGYRHLLDPYLARLEEAEAERSLRYRVDPEWMGRVERRPGVLPAPFLVVPRRCWGTGSLMRSGTVELRMEGFPVFPKANRPAIHAVLGITGCGKSNFLNALALARLDRGGFGLRLEIDVDDRMIPQLTALPLHREHPGYEALRELYGLTPRGLVVEKPHTPKSRVEKAVRDPNVLSLAVASSWRELEDSGVKPTAVDRIVFVEDPSAFHLPWERIARPGRLVCLRFVSERTTGRAFTSILKSFRLWRLRNKGIPAFIQIDEAFLGASARISMRYGRTYAMSSEEVEVFVRGARGLGVALDVSTQRAAYLAYGARSQVSHIFTSYLGGKIDVDAVVERLPVGVEDKKTLLTLLSRAEIRSDPYYWFIWINLLESSVKMVRPVLAPCGAEMPDRTAWDQFHEYGLAMEEWSQAKTLFDDIGTDRNPLPVYEPFLPEKELEKHQQKRGKRAIPATPEDWGSWLEEKGGEDMFSLR